MEATNQCQKCDAREGQNVALLGGFTAKLCFSCRNHWHQYLSTRGLWSRYKQVQAQHASLNDQLTLGIDGLDQDFKKFFAEEESLMSELFDTAETWLASPSSNA